MKKLMVVLVVIVLIPSLVSAQYRRDRDHSHGHRSYSVRIDPGALFLAGAGLVILDSVLDAAMYQSSPRVVYSQPTYYQPRMTYAPAPTYQAPAYYPASPECQRYSGYPEYLAACERGVADKHEEERRLEERRRAEEQMRLEREAYEVGRKGSPK